MPIDLGQFKKKKVQEVEKKFIPETKIIPGEDEQKVVLSQLEKKVSKSKKTSKKIVGDKILNKNQMIHWFKEYIEENQNSFTLDWLRGQKLTFESVNEMRK